MKTNAMKEDLDMARQMTEEQKKAAAERLKAAREKKAAEKAAAEAAEEEDVFAGNSAENVDESAERDPAKADGRDAAAVP